MCNFENSYRKDSIKQIYKEFYLSMTQKTVTTINTLYFTYYGSFWNMGNMF